MRSAAINYFGCPLIPSRYRMVNRCTSSRQPPPHAMLDSERIVCYTYGSLHTNGRYTVNTSVCSRNISMNISRYQSADYNVRTIININSARWRSCESTLNWPNSWGFIFTAARARIKAIFSSAEKKRLECLWYTSRKEFLLLNNQYLFKRLQ